MTKKTLQLKSFAWMSIALLLGVVCLYGGVKAFSSSQPPANVVEHADTVVVNQATLPFVPDSQPPVGAMAQDTSASNHLNVNGFDTYTLVGKVGNGGGYATTSIGFADPFTVPTSTSGDVVLEQLSDAYGLTGATSTVTLVSIFAGTTVTTTHEWDCTAAATRFATSTPSLVNTEQVLTTSTPYVVRSDMTSSTNPGAGSFVQDGKIAAFLPVTEVVLTPQKPYLVCKAWQPYGSSLSTFTDVNGSANVTVTAVISRQR